MNETTKKVGVGGTFHYMSLISLTDSLLRGVIRASEEKVWRAIRYRILKLDGF